MYIIVAGVHNEQNEHVILIIIITSLVLSRDIDILWGSDNSIYFPLVVLYLSLELIRLSFAAATMTRDPLILQRPRT